MPNDNYIAPSKPRGGRPPGSRNKRTIEGEEFARSIVTDPEYQAVTRKRAMAGELPPVVEQTLLHYAFGKPTEHLHVTASHVDEDFSQLSYDELAHQCEQLAVAIHVVEMEDAMREATVAAAEANLARRELQELNAALAATPSPDGQGRTIGDSTTQNNANQPMDKESRR